MAGCNLIVAVQQASCVGHTAMRRDVLRREKNNGPANQQDNNEHGKGFDVR